MTLDNVFQQWKSYITTDGTSVTIPSGRDGAKVTRAKGYVKCDLTGIVPADVQGGAAKEFPFKVVFVPADGKADESAAAPNGYVLDMTKSDDRSDSDYAAGSETASGKFVPVNNTLLKMLMSSDWVVGSAAEFETARDGSSLIW